MRILITGGSGTIGKAFIKEFPEHKYFNVSRNEKFLTDLMREHPDVTNFIGNIEDKEFLFRVFKDIDKAKHIGSMFTFRTVLPNREEDDARPTLVENPIDNIFNLFSGKIGTCIDAAEQIIEEIK